MRDGPNRTAGAGAGQLVAIHRSPALAGARQSQAIRRDGLGCPDVFVVVARAHARQVQPHGITVNGPAEREVPREQAGRCAGIVDLAGDTGQAGRQAGGHAVQEAVAAAQHGAGRGGVVLLEVRTQSIPRVRQRRRGVHAPTPVGQLQGIAAHVVDEVAAAGQQDAHCGVAGIAGRDALSQGEIARGATGTHIYRAGGRHTHQAIDTPHGQGAAIAERQTADIPSQGADLVRAAIEVGHPARAHSQLVGGQGAAAADAGAIVTGQHQGASCRADSRIQTQPTLGRLHFHRARRGGQGIAATDAIDRLALQGQPVAHPYADRTYH